MLSHSKENNQQGMITDCRGLSFAVAFSENSKAGVFVVCHRLTVVVILCENDEACITHNVTDQI